MKSKRRRIKIEKVDKVDRSSLALWKELMAKVSADAESEVKRRIQSMSVTESAKFKSLLNNIRSLGDVGKAAGKSRVRRTLLDKWMKTPGISWKINTAFNEARLMAHAGDTADDILFRGKVVPQLENDAEFFKRTGQRHRESKVIAKHAAKDLKQWRWHIAQAANNTDKGFFIDLGRILSGEVSGDLYDKLDGDIAEIYAKNPMISTRKALVELERRGYESVEEQTLRTRKSRLRLRKGNRKL